MKSDFEIYTQLKFIRDFELKVAEVYPTDKIKSPIHLSLGQEFVSVAICQHLSDSDFVAGTYRGHAAYLAKGGCPKALIAEMYGKESGCAKGRGGSMHLISPEANVIGTSAIVGTGVPVATGYALTQKMKKTNNIVVCFLGDGATEEGCFYESINFAGLHKLPILFVVENNKYAIHEPISKRWADHNLSKRVDGFGLTVDTHKDGNIATLSVQADRLIKKIKDGEGPALIEVDCYRWYQHVGPDKDFDQGYRSEDDLNDWVERDPVEQLKSKLSPQEILNADEYSRELLEKAFEFAENSPFPEKSELYKYVYKS